MKNQKSLLCPLALVVGLFLFVFRGNLSAVTVEGFESLTLNAGNSIGDASIQTPNFFGINPTEGTHQLLLTTISTAGAHDVLSPASGTNAAAVSNVATFLGITTAQIRNTLPGAPVNATGQEGSAFKLSLGFLGAGSVVTLNYNFLTADLSGARDFAFYALTGLSGNTPTIADTQIATIATSAGNPFNLHSAYQNFTINITTDGTYTLGLGIMDATNTAGPTGLLIDNIAVTVAPIPEPSTVALSVAGALLFAALRRRIK